MSSEPEDKVSTGEKIDGWHLDVASERGGEGNQSYILRELSTTSKRERNTFIYAPTTFIYDYISW